MSVSVSVLRFRLTIAAAQEVERRFIGIDIDASHCQTARKRLRFAEGLFRSSGLRTRRRHSNLNPRLPCP